MNFLQVIKEKAKKRNEIYQGRISELEQLAYHSPLPHDFVTQFQASKEQRKIIAEVKFASPLRGVIANLDPVDVAASYLTNGATALSVLTEPEYFHGNIEYIRAIREQFPESLLLMKDFIIARAQLFQARIFGADSILLIVALLDVQELNLLYHQALELGLTPLVEIHNQQELEVALKLGAKLIGINNRDLTTLKISLNTSLKLADCIPGGVTKISESGITSAREMQLLSEMGIDGFLIGTSLMTTQEPGYALQQLMKENQNVS
jgi:indole-3-glycerol phosphate synthase